MKNRTVYTELYVDGEYWGKYEMAIRATKDAWKHEAKGRAALTLSRKADGSLTGKGADAVDRTVSDAGFNRWMGR